MRPIVQPAFLAVVERTECQLALWRRQHTSNVCDWHEFLDVLSSQEL